jgi:hypothetical protein
LLLAGSPPLPGSAAAEPSPAGIYSKIEAGRPVEVRNLPPADVAPRIQRPRLTRNPQALAQRKAHGPEVSSAPASSTIAPESATAAAPAKPQFGIKAAQGTVLEQLTVFTGMTVDQGRALYGSDQALEPPDAQIAVGTNYVVEMVNRNASIWTRSGVLVSTFDLNPFYQSVNPALYGSYSATDPRIFYDAGNSQRWFASAAGINNTNQGVVFLAVSQNSDPTGTWYRFALPPRPAYAVLPDQPELGISDDKVALAWGDYRPPGCDPTHPTNFCFAGQEIWILQKSELIANAVTSTYVLTPIPDPNLFGVVPVQSMSATTTQYLVYNNADPAFLVENQCAQPSPPPFFGACPRLSVIAVTGQPKVPGSMGRADSHALIASTTAPPDAPQAGSAKMIVTGDDRLVTAVWQNNVLWTAFSDGNRCSVPNPIGTPPGSCAHFIQASTATTPPTILQDFVVGASADYLYYPAVSLDVAGDMFSVFSRSNKNMYASTYVTSQLATATPNVAPPISLMQAGQGPYDTSSCGGRNGWGDYSGAARDPVYPTDVWVAGEFTPLGTSSCSWATSIGRLTMSAPAVSGINPTQGPTVGGTTVSVTGSDFLDGNTTVYFGSVPSRTVSVQTPNLLTAVAPDHLCCSAPAPVSVVAITPDGQSPAGPVFTYVARAEGPVADSAAATPRTNTEPRAPLPAPSTGRPGVSRPASILRAIDLSPEATPSLPSPNWGGAELVPSLNRGGELVPSRELLIMFGSKLAVATLGLLFFGRALD